MNELAAEQRATIGLIEPLIVRRRAAWRGELAAISREVGVQDAALAFLLASANAVRDGVVTAAAQREKAPYHTKEPWRASWAVLVASGLAEALPEAWRLTPQGLATLDRLERSSWTHFASLALPRAELARAREALEGVVARVPADTPRMRWIRRIRPRGPDADADGVRLEHAVLLLLMHRIDAHVSAWRSAGYEGPELDVLSQVWGGLGTFEAVERALASKQEAADVRRHAAALAVRGDVSVDGERLSITARGRERRDRIEAETDRVGLAPWPEGVALAALRRDLEALAAAMPGGEPARAGGEG